MSGPFLIMIFVFSYVLAKSPKKENKTESVVKEVKEEKEAVQNEEI